MFVRKLIFFRGVPMYALLFPLSPPLVPLSPLNQFFIFDSMLPTVMSTSPQHSFLQGKRVSQSKTLLSDAHPRAHSLSGIYCHCRACWARKGRRPLGMGDLRSASSFLVSHHYCYSSVPSCPSLYFISIFFVPCWEIAPSCSEPFWFLLMEECRVGERWRWSGINFHRTAKTAEHDSYVTATFSHFKFPV